MLREWEEIRKIISRTHYFSVRNSGRHKLQGVEIVDQTRGETDTQLCEGKRAVETSAENKQKPHVV